MRDENPDLDRIDVSIDKQYISSVTILFRQVLFNTDTLPILKKVYSVINQCYTIKPWFKHMKKRSTSLICSLISSQMIAWKNDDTNTCEIFISNMWHCLTETCAWYSTYHVKCSHGARKWPMISMIYYSYLSEYDRYSSRECVLGCVRCLVRKRKQMRILQFKHVLCSSTRSIHHSQWNCLCINTLNTAMVIILPLNVMCT
jgi:hypothetical protein